MGFRPLRNPQKAFEMDSVATTIIHCRKITKVIEGFAQNCLCNKSLNKSGTQNKISLRQRKIVRLAFGLWID
jgi:hypothetical protein